MTFLFDRKGSLVVVDLRLAGPAGSAVVPVALDTGATCTLVSAATLAAIGLDPALSRRRTLIMTGSGIEYAPRLVVPEVSALGVTRKRLSVVSHTLPAGTDVDGLLGLDFLRRTKLSIDFRAGRLHLE